MYIYIHLIVLHSHLYNYIINQIAIKTSGPKKEKLCKMEKKEKKETEPKHEKSTNRMWNEDWHKNIHIVSVPQPSASAIRIQLQRVINVKQDISHLLSTNKECQGTWLILRSTDELQSLEQVHSLGLTEIWPFMPLKETLPKNSVLALVHVTSCMRIEHFLELSKIENSGILNTRVAKLLKGPWCLVLDRIIPLRKIKLDLTACNQFELANEKTIDLIKQQIALTHLTLDELKNLCHVFPLHMLPEEAKTQKDEPAKVPKAKVYATELPSPKTIKLYRHLAQGSKEWHLARERTAGSSTLGPICNVHGFKSNVDVYMGEAGLIADDERYAEEFFFMNHGNFFEHVVFNEKQGVYSIYCILMRCKGRTLGLVVNVKYCANHSSPDAVSHFPKYIRHNLYTLEDWLQGLAEIKNHVFGPILIGEPCIRTTKVVNEKPITTCKPGKVQHKISPEYAVQVMNQMDVISRPYESNILTELVKEFTNAKSKSKSKSSIQFTNLKSEGVTNGIGIESLYKYGTTPLKFNDFVSNWRLNERKPPFEFKNTGHKSLLNIGTHYICRVYFEERFAEIIIEYLKKHVAAVQSRTKPDKYPVAPFPPFSMVPLKHVLWFIHPEPILSKEESLPFEYTVDDLQETFKKYKPRGSGTSVKQEEEQKKKFESEKKIYKTIVQTFTTKMSTAQIKDAYNNKWLKDLEDLHEYYISVVVHHYWDCPIFERNII